MIVFSYFEPVAGLPIREQLLEIAEWKRSWQQYGWRPVILSHAYVARSADHAEITNGLRRLPSVNPPGYDLNCYLRWLALANAGGGLMTDYDTVNIGYTPAMHAEVVGGYPLVELHHGRVPAMLHASADTARAFMHTFLSYAPDASDVEAGRPHVSDMTILQKTHRGHAHVICHEAHDMKPGTGVVHCSRAALHRLGRREPRHVVMAELATKHAKHALFDPTPPDTYFRDLVEVNEAPGRADTQSCWQVIVAEYFNNCTLLDVGTGLNRSKGRMQIRGITVTSQEPGIDMVADIKEDVSEIPSASFDTVTAFDVIEHVRNVETFMGHLKRIARKHVVITTPNFLVTGNRHVYHYREFTTAEMLALMGGRDAFVTGWAMTAAGPIRFRSYDELLAELDCMNYCIVARAR